MKTLFLFLAACLPIASMTFAQSFNEVAQASGIDHLHVTQNFIGGGSVFFDYDNDGLMDIYLTGGTQTDGLYRNLGNGSFSEATFTAGLAITGSSKTVGAVAGDIDNDGDRDLFVTVENSGSNFLFENMGDGTFQHISAAAGIIEQAFSVSATMGDYNLDGFLDIYVANYTESLEFLFDSTGTLNGFAHNCFPNYLYINNGDKTFTESAVAYAIADTGCGLAAAFTNYDLDNDMDIYVANDFGEFVVSNRMYENQFPIDQFTDVSAATGMDIGLYGMGIARGDYDEDGDFDYYVTNLGRNVLLQNDGNSNFTDVTAFAGVENAFVAGKFTTGWGTMFADVDNDSYEDLFVSNGQVPAAGFIATYTFDPCKLYMNNNGDGTFTDVSDSAGVANTDFSRGSAFADYDNDGDIDLLVTNIYPGVFARHALLFENTTVNSNNYLQVELEGVQTNRDALGALVKLYAGGRVFMREIDGGSSHASQNTSIAHFGLGTISSVDSLVIKWPGGNQQTEIINGINQRLLFVEDLANMTCQVVEATQSSNVSETTVDLGWSGVSAFGGYVIRGKEISSSTFVQLTIPQGDARFKKIVDLTPATTYMWQIKKRCDAAGSNESEWSAPDTFTTKCSSPNIIASTNVTDNSVTLNWNPVAGVSGYRLLGINTMFPANIVSIDFPNTVSSFPVVDLPAGNTFIWTVISKCNAAGDELSSIITADTFMTASPAQKSVFVSSADHDFEIYPNPAHDRVKIVLPTNLSDSELKVSLHTLTGREIKVLDYRPSLNERILNFNLPAKISSGIYQISISTDREYLSKRLIIAN